MRHQEDDGTVAKKAAKRAAGKKATKTPKAAPRPAAKAATKAPVKAAVKAPVKAAATRPAAPARPAPASAGPDLGERAERLRDEILRSKLTHPDPWSYATKARAWGERAQTLVQRIAIGGDAASAKSALEALDAELRRDRDFQEARRLF